MKKEFSISLGFNSFVSIVTLVGFFAGTTVIPLVVLMVPGVTGAILAVILSPTVGAVHGAMLGALAYPIYLLLKLKFNLVSEVKLAYGS